jgi:hypothetical protein
VLFCGTALFAQTATYIGSEMCKTCHNGTLAPDVYSKWSATLHSKIHLKPSASTIKGDFAQTVVLQLTSASAPVVLSVEGGKYYATVGRGGTKYEIAYTYGGGWKQRYLVKIENSYYMLPIQWNLNKYLDNSSGAWVAYNATNWFNNDGSVKPVNNTFRTKSWDKNCAGCHITGVGIQGTVTGTDTAWVASWASNSSDKEIVVGCEACHGPGSLHLLNFALPDKKIVNPRKLTDNTRKLEVCGQCHNRGSSKPATAGAVGTYEYLWDEVNNKGYVPGEVMANYFAEAAPNKTGGPGTWPDLVTARQHHQQYQEWKTSRHFTNTSTPMNCFTCHDPHAVTSTPYQIRDSLTVTEGQTTTTFKVTNDDNTLCLACHAGMAGPFQGITKDMVKDPVANKAAIGNIVSKHTRHSYDPDNKNNTNGSSRCSKCHLAKTAITAKAYDIHSHTFKVIEPKKTLDFRTTTTPTQGMLNSCAASCHRNASGAVALGVGSDATLTNWTEATDIALADTLNKAFQKWFPTVDVKQITGLSPKDYTLEQNYPNPFNPSTEIRFSLPQRSEVRLVVYNMIGQEVKTLMKGMMEPGQYTATWDATNNQGMTVGSGVYIYRLEAGKFSNVKKMIVTR